VSYLERISFAEIPGWSEDISPQALQAQKHSCKALQTADINHRRWQPFCTAVLSLDENDTQGYRDALETYLSPHKVSAGEPVLFTGYYEPLLHGSRQANKDYPCPLYGLPDATLHYRLPRRYLTEVLQHHLTPLVWVDSFINAFFLEIQGSGRIQLNTGEMMCVGYAGNNGYPYFPIGKALRERGEISAEALSLQSLKQWLRKNPEQTQSVLDLNQSYVFFRELTSEGPLGTQGVPLTPQHSVAIDPRFIPLGAPLWTHVTHPLKNTPLKQLMIAQDTGGAIKGPARADIFWGFGSEAEAAAGQMKEEGDLFVLLPQMSGI